MRTGNFLLVGQDFEGETREIWFETLANALKLARECTSPLSPGPAWLGWAVWGNDETTEEWKPLLTSDGGGK